MVDSAKEVYTHCYVILTKVYYKVHLQIVFSFSFEDSMCSILTTRDNGVSFWVLWLNTNILFSWAKYYFSLPIEGEWFLVLSSQIYDGNIDITWARFRRYQARTTLYAEVSQAFFRANTLRLLVICLPKLELEVRSVWPSTVNYIPTFLPRKLVTLMPYFMIWPT